MTMKSLILAAAVVTLATGGAFAQTSSGTMSGSGQDQMSAPGGKAQNNPARQTQEKDKSPAASDSGAKQEK
jgi:hypothetical protein